MLYPPNIQVVVSVVPSPLTLSVFLPYNFIVTVGSEEFKTRAPPVSPHGQPAFRTHTRPMTALCTQMYAHPDMHVMAIQMCPHLLCFRNGVKVKSDSARTPLLKWRKTKRSKAGRCRGGGVTCCMGSNNNSSGCGVSSI